MNERLNLCPAVLELLREAGIPLDDAQMEKLAAHVRQVREWNRVVSLVSRSDLQELERRHVVDSLSLVAYVREAASGGGRLLDIGSGGGFPAIPLKIALPELSVTLVERSERKVGFLRHVVAVLGLEDVEIIWGEFPRDAPESGVSAVTARAVEKPGKLARDLGLWLPEGANFLCQSGDPRPLLEGMFHVEHIRDTWTEAGLRRGELYRVRK